MKYITLFLGLCFLLLSENASAKYSVYQCTNLKIYKKYLKTAKKGVLQKHPKCNAAAIKAAYQSNENKKLWIEQIEGPYRNYFGHPSSVFRYCDNCISTAPKFDLDRFKKGLKGDFVFVLSIDGGGVRGLIPAIVLQDLEKEMGMPIHKIFDVYVGTSTGGLISLMLNVPDDKGHPKYTVSDIVQLYKNLSKKVFRRGNFLRSIRSRLSLTSKYSIKSYEQLLRQYFGNVIMQQSYKPVVVTSINVVERTPFYFSTVKLNSQSSRSRFMWEAARATSAAPFYFKPFVLRRPGENLKLIDGGVGINNPSIVAIMMAKQLFPNKKIFFVSLSTGTKLPSKKYKTSGPFGGGVINLKGNVSNVLDNLMSAPSAQNHAFTESLLKSEGSLYYRIKSDELANIQMDDASPKALKRLENIGHNIVKLNKNYMRLKVVLKSIMEMQKKQVPSGSVQKLIAAFEGRNTLNK